MYDLKGATILVTGASGYVGRNLVSYLLSRGHTVIACSRSAADADKSSVDGCRHRVLDYADPVRLRGQLADVDVIFHAAADLRNWGSETRLEDFNRGATARLLAAASGRVRRFVLVSTEAVLLGTRAMLNISEKTPYPEKPIGQYAWSKQAAEKLVLAVDTNVMECVSVRPRMIWGRDDTTILPKLISAVASGRFIWIGGGRYPTSTTHIDNLCECLYLAAQRGRAGQCYFVTDGAPVSFRDFVLHQLRDYRGDIPRRSLPRAIVLSLAWAVESLWGLLRLQSTPPIMRSQVYLTGSPVTVDDSLARVQLGYQGKSFKQLASEDIDET